MECRLKPTAAAAAATPTKNTISPDSKVPLRPDLFGFREKKNKRTACTCDRTQSILDSVPFQLMAN